MADHGIRNLDEIREDEGARMPRSVTWTLIALGGACLLFAGLVLGGRGSHPRPAKSDPLGDLVSQQGQRPQPSPSARAPSDLSPSEVTFPHILSDDDSTTTALAAVKANGAAAAAPSARTAAPVTKPPPATDRLPVVPLPAEAVLEASPIVTRPRDPLTQAASEAAQITNPPAVSESAPEGHEGGYQLQVSSFHTQAEADSFADQLRARGHKAYVMEAHVAGRGTWYRVRIGPFSTQHAAAQYRATFESREHVVPFVVPPETTAKAH
jgi:cell division septation protein DedD